MLQRDRQTDRQTDGSFMPIADLTACCSAIGQKGVYTENRFQINLTSAWNLHNIRFPQCFLMEKLDDSIWVIRSGAVQINRKCRPAWNSKRLSVKYHLNKKKRQTTWLKMSFTFCLYQNRSIPSSRSRYAIESTLLFVVKHFCTLSYIRKRYIGLIMYFNDI